MNRNGSSRASRLCIVIHHATVAARDLYSPDLENAENKQLFLRSVLESSKVLNGVNQLSQGTHDLISQESPSYVLLY